MGRRYWVLPNPTPHTVRSRVYLFLLALSASFDYPLVVLSLCVAMEGGRFKDLARLNLETLDVLGTVVGVGDDMALLNKGGKVDAVRFALMEFVGKEC
jgi:hypothetical protein